MKNETVSAGNAEVNETGEVKKATTAFYPDVAFNKKERKKTVMLSALLIVLMGGMGLTIILGGIQNGGGSMSFISGALTLVCLIFAISMIPNAFKQYPTKNKPLIEVKPREIVINGTAVKISDIYQMRLTLTVDATGKKDEILQTLEALASKEPPRHTTGNLDFAVKDVKPDKPKTLYTTVADSYEALIAVFSAGVKHYDIVYAAKKQSIKSTYDLMNSSVTVDGTKLSDLSKKERRKQLF